jgi:hypothetical protein
MPSALLDTGDDDLHTPNVLVWWTANGSSADAAEWVGPVAIKPPTDLCRRVLGGRQVGTVPPVSLMLSDLRASHIP